MSLGNSRLQTFRLLDVFHIASNMHSNGGQIQSSFAHSKFIS